MKKSAPLKKISRKKIISILLVIIAVAVLIGATIYFTKLKTSENSQTNSGQVSEEEAADLVEKVGKLIKLPGEIPSVATVSDINQLQNQTLFKDAQNGDKVLIFNQAKKAYVYRPATNQIIEVGSIVITPESVSSPSAQSIEPTQIQEQINISLFNGTKTVGYAKKVGSDLSDKFSYLKVSETANAASDYEKSIVVDLSGTNSDAANAIAAELGGEVGELPEGEESPANTDILIILGN